MPSSFRSPLRALARGALDLAIPRVCLLCEALMGTQPGLVCLRCWTGVVELPRPRCRRCDHPRTGDTCQWCPLLLEQVVAARSVCWVPEGGGGAIVHKLKYGGWTGLGADMAGRIVRGGRTWEPGTRAILVPVPLGRGRLRERGFNQCAEIGKKLAALWRIDMFDGVVTRQRETESQVLLTPDQRSVNVHNAFAAGPAADAARGAHVVLVDDVVTTGATLNACAATVLAAGAATISYVTFGRARAAFDRASPSGE